MEKFFNQERETNLHSLGIVTQIGEIRHMERKVTKRFQLIQTRDGMNSSLSCSVLMICIETSRFLRRIIR